MIKLQSNQTLTSIHPDIEHMYDNFIKDASHYVDSKISASQLFDAKVGEIAHTGLAQFHQYLICTDEHKRIGFVITAQAGNQVDILACYTRPKFRHQGYMTTAIQDIIRTESIHNVKCHILFENTLGRVSMKKILQKLNTDIQTDPDDVYNPKIDWVTLFCIR